MMKYTLFLILTLYVASFALPLFHRIPSDYSSNVSDIIVAKRWLPEAKRLAEQYYLFYFCLRMAEGGWLPWKNQRPDKDVVDLEYFKKSLPPPPAGFEWKKKSDGNWELCKHQNEVVVEKTVNVDENVPDVIEHTVMSEDTLQGICLKYNVSVRELRRINLFSGTNIQVKHTLLIPLKRGAVAVTQVETREVLLQKFRNATGEGIQEAKMYLDDHAWNLTNALAAWKIDEQWDENEDDSDMKRLKKQQFASNIGEDDDQVLPLAIEGARECAPLAVTFHPPTQADIEMIAASNKARYGTEITNTQAAIPLLLG